MALTGLDHPAGPLEAAYVMEKLSHQEFNAAKGPADKAAKQAKDAEDAVKDATKAFIDVAAAEQMNKVADAIIALIS